MPQPDPQQPGERALALHREACERGQPGYLDPNSGLFVLSSHTLREQGACCGQGCRHCPWPAEEQARAGRPRQPAFPWPPPDRLGS